MYFLMIDKNPWVYRLKSLSVDCKLFFMFIHIFSADYTCLLDFHSAFGSTKRPSPEVRETPLMRPPSRSEQLLGTLPPFFQTESHTVLHDQECIIAKVGRDKSQIQWNLC